MLRSSGPLICLWAAVLSMSAVGAAGLQVLGPPARPIAATGHATVQAEPGALPPVAPAELQAALAAPSPVLPAPLQPAPFQPEVSAVPDAPTPRPRATPRRSDPEDAPRRSVARRSPLPPETVAAPFVQPAPPAAAPSYIGIYGAGADGTRAFRSAP